jgi:hypothetical protein
MPKYYVQSGQMKHIIDRKTRKQAIVDTLIFYRGKGLMTNLKICVSEIGWDIQMTCYETDSFLKDI